MNIIFAHVKKHSTKLTCSSRFVVFNNYSITRIIDNDDNDNNIKVTDLKEEITKVATITSAYGVKKPKPRRKIMKLGLNRPIIKAQIERNKKLEEDAMISQLPWRIMGST